VAEERFARWLSHVYDVDAPEIDCSSLQLLLPAYIESELGLASQSLAAGEVVAVRIHLEHCPDCREEYQGVRQVVTLELGGELPEVDELLARFADPKEQPEPAAELAHYSS
jgi:hypothetical protein